MDGEVANVTLGEGPASEKTGPMEMAEAGGVPVAAGLLE